MTESSPDNQHVLTLGSRALQRLWEMAPPDHVTLRWVLDRLQNQSFGLLLVLLAIVGAAPGVCTFAGVLMIIVAFQIAVGRRTPYFPRWLADHVLPTRHLDAVTPHAVVVLRFLEKGVHPRWPGMIAVAKPFVGVVILMLSLRLTLFPVPLSNVIPAVFILLIALAYLEEDGLSLAISIAAGLAMLGIDSAVLWRILHSQNWLPMH